MTYFYPLIRLKNSPIFIALLLVFVSLYTEAALPIPAAVYITRQSGNFNDARTWLGGRVPETGATVLVKTGHKLTINVNTPPLDQLQILPGGEVRGDATGKILTLADTRAYGLNNDGTINFSGNYAATIKLAKNGKWDGSGIFNLSDLDLNTKTLSFSPKAGFTLNLSAAVPILHAGRLNGVPKVKVRFNGTQAQTLPTDAGLRYGDIEIANRAGVYLDGDLNKENLINHLTIASGQLHLNGHQVQGTPKGNFSMQQQFTMAPGTTLVLEGASAFPANFKSYDLDKTSTVHYTGGGSQTIKALNYGNLEISGQRGSKTVYFDAGVIGVAGTLKASATFSGGGYAGGNLSTLVLNGNGNQSLELENAPLKLTRLAIWGGGTKSLLGSQHLQVAEQLVLVSGLLATSPANAVQILPGGKVMGGNSRSYVRGNLAKQVNPGSNVSPTFEIGDEQGYSPLTLTFPSVTTSGRITAGLFAAATTGQEGSCIDPDNRVKKVWKLSNEGLAPAVYNTTFQFKAQEVAGGPAAGFEVDIFTQQASQRLVPAARTASSVTLSNASAFGYVQIGLYNVQPVITAAPAPVAVLATGQASFSLAASGKLSYQWQVSSDQGATWTNVSDNELYSGAAGATLTVNAVPRSLHQSQYRCQVSNLCGSSLVSTPATLTVKNPYYFTSQPVSASGCEASPLTFTATAANAAGAAYLWQVSTDGGSSWQPLSPGGQYGPVNTATLTVTPAYASNGYQYRCSISNGQAPEYSSPATLTVDPQTKIKGQPQPASVQARDNATFTVASEAAGAAYQWQVNKGQGWVTLSDSAFFQGAHTATLVLAGVPWHMDRSEFRCLVTGKCGTQVISQPAALQITNLSSYLTQPAQVSACEGEMASFPAILANTSGVTYQWQQSKDGGSWSDLSESSHFVDVKGATLQVKAAAEAHQSLFRCLLTSPNYTYITAATSFSVLEQPAITSQASAVVSCQDSPAAFAIQAAGSAISYQWQVNTGDGNWTDLAEAGIYAGASSPSLALSSATQALSGYQYRCQVSNACATVITSAPVALTVVGANTWKGLSSDWQDPNNWCGQVPTADTDVIIQTGVPHMPLVADASCRNLRLEAGAELTMTGDFAIHGTPTLLGTLSVGSHTLTLNGGPIQGEAANLATSPASSLVLGGTGTGVTVPASIRTLKKLVVANSSATGVSLAADLHLDSLEFRQGKLFLQASNLRMSSPGAISGQDSTRYVVTNNAPNTGGFLSQPVGGNGSYVTFPVGTAQGYSPAQVQLSSASAADVFSVRVFDQLLAQGTKGKPLMSNGVNKTWLIEEALPGGSDATLKLGWLKKEELPGFNKTRIMTGHYKNEKWELSTTVMSYEQDKDGINWLAQSGYTDFSPFSVLDETAAGMLVPPVVSAKVFLQGAYAGNGKMRTDLTAVLPLSQPYNMLPFDYAGTEAVEAGFFSATNKIVDWVLLELRTGTDASTTVARKACLLNENGLIVDTDGKAPAFAGLEAGNYYLVVRHRNHLSVMSAQPLALNGNSELYDFSTQKGQYYGADAALLATGVYGLYGGDANSSDVVSVADHAPISLNLNRLGHLLGDLDLSGLVNAADRNLIFKNQNKMSKVPQ